MTQISRSKKSDEKEPGTDSSDREKEHEQITQREDRRTSNLVHRRSTKTHMSDKRRDLQGQRSRLQGYVTRLTVLDDKSRTKRPRNTKICRKVVHPTGNNVHQFQGQRSRSPGQLMLRQKCVTVISSKREGLRTSNLAHRWSTKTRVTESLFCLANVCLQSFQKCTLKEWSL